MRRKFFRDVTSCQDSFLWRHFWSRMRNGPIPPKRSPWNMTWTVLRYKCTTIPTQNIGGFFFKILDHIMLYRAHLAWAGIELTTLVVIGTDCICSCKSNYHTITTTTPPNKTVLTTGPVFIVRTVVSYS